MNIVESIIAIFIILIVVMNFIAEPKLSMQYFKASITSTGKIYDNIKTTITDWMSDDGEDLEAVD